MYGNAENNSFMSFHKKITNHCGYHGLLENEQRMYLETYLPYQIFRSYQVFLSSYHNVRHTKHVPWFHIARLMKYVAPCEHSYHLYLSTWQPIYISRDKRCLITGKLKHLTKNLWRSNAWNSSVVFQYSNNASNIY